MSSEQPKRKIIGRTLLTVRIEYKESVLFARENIKTIRTELGKCLPPVLVEDHILQFCVWNKKEYFNEPCHGTTNSDVIASVQSKTC